MYLYKVLYIYAVWYVMTLPTRAGERARNVNTVYVNHHLRADCCLRHRPSCRRLVTRRPRTPHRQSRLRLQQGCR